MELAAGRPPKERRTTYVRVEHEIAQAELKVRIQTGHLFCCVFPVPTAERRDTFVIQMLTYLDHVSYLVKKRKDIHSTDCEFHVG